MSLQRIDFTNGIRADKINENFNTLERELNQYRLNTFGYGIFGSNGFNVSVNDSIDKIIVTDGCIICKNGSMLNISGKEYDISVQNYSVTYSIGVTIKENDNNSAELSFYVSNASTSPSFYMPINNNDEYFLLLATVVIIPNSTNGTVEKYIKSYTSDRTNIFTNENNELYIGGKKFNDIKYIYLSRPEEPRVGDLWLNTGFGYNDLLICKVITNDVGNNEFVWVPVTKYDYNIYRTKKYWNPSSVDENGNCYNGLPMHNEYFVFNINDPDMYYQPNTNSIDIIFDNSPLHSDQYSEITILDVERLLNNNNTENDIKNYFESLGYTKDSVNSIIYESISENTYSQKITESNNIGIGFKLSNPISYNPKAENDYEKGPYIEAIVTHSIRSQVEDKPVHPSIFEKTIEYAGEGNVKNYNVYLDPDIRYQRGYHQLEVFLNGIKLNNNEFSEYSKDAPYMLATIGNEDDTYEEVQVQYFTINTTIKQSDKITYRITTFATLKLD